MDQKQNLAIPLVEERVSATKREAGGGAITCEE
jgi:hypothetical protein